MNNGGGAVLEASFDVLVAHTCVRAVYIYIYIQTHTHTHTHTHTTVCALRIARSRTCLSLYPTPPPSLSLPLVHAAVSRLTSPDSQNRLPPPPPPTPPPPPQHTRQSDAKTEREALGNGHIDASLVGFSPATRPSSSVLWSLTSDNCRAPGRTLDTLLPISDAEYPAFYPMALKLVVCGQIHASLVQFSTHPRRRIPAFCPRLDGA
jgi:hypothetical protein